MKIIYFILNVINEFIYIIYVICIKVILYIVTFILKITLERVISYCVVKNIIENNNVHKLVDNIEFIIM